MLQEFVKAFIETLILIFIPGTIGVIFGLLLGMLLYILKPNSSFPSKGSVLGYNILSFSINIIRSIPFVILMIAILPLTRLLVGTTIGTIAACVPLAIAAIPFFARIVESAFLEVPYGIIEAAISMGATTRQILVNINLIEIRQQIIYGIILMLITLVGYSAMAGTLAGGGLGALAFNYGYQRFQNNIMIITVILIILIVQGIEMFGNWYLKKNFYGKK